MVKITLTALVCGVIIAYLKLTKSEFALPAEIGAGVIILGVAYTYFTQTFDFIQKLADIGGVDGTFFSIILKITAIGFIVEFGAGTLCDFNLNSLSEKLQFVGKIVIITMSLPIFYAVINIISGLVG